MARWDNPGIPHKGWNLIGYEDINGHGGIRGRKSPTSQRSN